MACYEPTGRGALLAARGLETVTLLDSWVPAVLGACLMLAAGDPLVPDRPDVSNGTGTVPAGAAQLEVGFELESTPRPRARPSAVGASSLRIGVTPRAELRLFEGDAIAWAVAGAGGDPQAAFGAKLRLFDGRFERRVPSLGLTPLVVSRRPGGAWLGDPPATTLVLLVGQPLTRRLGIDINAGLRIDAAASRRHAYSALVSASLGFSVDDRVLLFGEAYGVAAEPGLAAFGMDGGVLFTVAPELALDLAVRTDVVGEPTVGLMVGVTGRYEGRRQENRRERRNPVPQRGRALHCEPRLIAVRRNGARSHAIAPHGFA